MRKSILFYFTGTGNSLKVAKDVAATIGNCELYNIGAGVPVITEEYDYIGFVYPTYFFGLPKIVKEFMEQLDFSKNTNTYTFAVATYGGTLVNGVREANEVLKAKGVKRLYGGPLKMVDNYILLYDTGVKVDEKTKASDEGVISILNDIKNKKENTAKKPNALARAYSNRSRKNVHKKAEDFHVSSACIGCNKCEELCPVNNIKMKDSKPVFGKACEQCMGCIQYCPTKAINYKNKTEKRGRYTNPTIKVNEIIATKNHK